MYDPEPSVVIRRPEPDIPYGLSQCEYNYTICLHCLVCGIVAEEGQCGETLTRARGESAQGRLAFCFISHPFNCPAIPLLVSSSLFPSFPSLLADV